MQSIKNTSLAILLLFLSYGVYQVIMKPMPSSQSAEIDGLAITDSVESLHADSPAELDDPIAGNELQSAANAIPPSLLQSPQSEAGEVNDVHVELGEFTPPKSQAFDSEVRLEAAANNSTDDFEPPHSNQSETELDPPGDFDPDSQVMTKPSMADVTPRPVRPSGPELDGPSESMLMTDSEPPKPPAATPNLAEAWPKINSLVEEGQYQQALLALSTFYRADDLNAEERQQLLDWLDALAAKVIYSSEHHLQSVPYIIQPGDTIASLARQWQVPAQLIYNVNSGKIADPNELTAGVEIKLIQGPFDAEVEPASQTLTLFLDGMYAGRFNINANPTLQSGEFGIVNKSAQDQLDRPYWISLSNGVSIYASENVPVDNSEIGLDPGEAEEVFSILSASSKIRVLR